MDEVADISSNINSASIGFRAQTSHKSVIPIELDGCSYSTTVGGSVAEWLRRWTCNSQVVSSTPGPALSSNNLGQSCLHPRASAGRSGLAMA